MTGRMVVVGACMSAVLLWAAMPPIDLAPLAWIALVPVALATRWAPTDRTARAAVPLAYALFLELLLVPALPFGLTEDQWGDTPLPVLVGDSPVFVVAFVAVPMFGLGLYALRFPQPWPRTGTFAWLIVPAATWTALDFARIKLDPGGLFGPLSVSQHSALPGALAAVGGPCLITFALVACNYGLALMLAWRRPTAAAVGGAALMFTALLSPSLLWPSPNVERLRTVAAVQPGYDTAEFERPVLRNFRPGSYDIAALDMVADLVPLTHAAARRGASLVVWPEATLWVDPRLVAPVRRALRLLARESETTIVVPYFLPGPDHGATVAVDPDGSFTATQPKQRPMWFWGEDGGNRRLPRPASTEAGVIGTTLGVDNQDPRPVRLLSKNGAELVTSSTHDWKQLAPLQVAFAQLHALESRVPVVRADWRFGSAVFDRDGNAVADAGRSKRRTVVVAGVSMRGGSTPYSYIGDLFGWASAAAALVLLGVGMATQLRRRVFASRAG